MALWSEAAAKSVDVAALRTALEAAPEVLVADLFGSQATGTAGPTSDVDLAVLTAGTLPDAGRLALMADLQMPCRADGLTCSCSTARRPRSRIGCCATASRCSPATRRPA